MEKNVARPASLFFNGHLRVDSLTELDSGAEKKFGGEGARLFVGCASRTGRSRNISRKGAKAQRK
jgi:hypothetical protein